MGFGKFLLGGVCAVGAIVAAPVVLPTAGLAIAASTATGAIGTTVGLAVATATPAAAAAVAGAAGIAAGSMVEKGIDDARWEGKQSGIKEASEVYEEKLRKQAEEFLAKERVTKEDKEKYVQLITKYKKALDEKEAQLKEMKRLNSDAFDVIAELENEVKEMRNQYDRVSHLLCA